MKIIKFLIHCNIEEYDSMTLVLLKGSNGGRPYAIGFPLRSGNSNIQRCLGIRSHNNNEYLRLTTINPESHSLK
ncbi:hypothetical protein MJO28_014068 [Puccinia striiformis f. sp. tritici]|uniref:Uncharacterized protein n=1 Tax=Puccinia striiformis f. sp. tritici TaxID=168172 RepID=A0ACC0DWD1_9BASI|nr:hypothetical protein MJO28_014068 [Puccinia striiformis f. sp. tritici]